MKYKRLSKEQLEELHQEFITFLATQSITAEEWEDIKKNKPQVAEEEIDVFSDLVWDSVLSKAEYLEHFSPNQMHLFKLEEEGMKLIAIKIDYPDIDITTREGYEWLRNNLMDEKVLFYNSKKEYSSDPNADRFDLILKGANITKGELFTYFESLID
ncbi:DUF6495 family protein [Aquimarina brevivitae]|uniref:Histidyl-tRNA synthetase n=1 Tax=Aquimarina brevivitae TaxID=323412 RepID=A0A4Q7NU39_9FLAO|nr:DUF6495 family protein [Aquimarina brevivitae]RZS90703.1 hypothetical protein EV197_3233 [Aquimarina brevivitae]